MLVVEELGGGQGVGEGAVAGVKEEGGVLGGICRGDEPAVELGLACGGDSEVDFGEGEME